MCTSVGIFQWSVSTSFAFSECKCYILADKTQISVTEQMVNHPTSFDLFFFILNPSELSTTCYEVEILDDENYKCPR